jgi:hypothetical protein
MVIDTDCIDSCKPYYNTSTTTTAPFQLGVDIFRKTFGKIRWDDWWVSIILRRRCRFKMSGYKIYFNMWFPLWFPHKQDVRFVFNSSCLYEGLCLIYVICGWWRIVVFNTYCVVLRFVCLRLVYPMLPISELSIFDYPFGILRRFLYIHAFHSSAYQMTERPKSNDVFEIIKTTVLRT